MQFSRLRCRLKTCVIILLASALLISASPVSANDPPPSCPVLQPIGTLGWHSQPVAATEEQWQLAADMVNALYPDSDFTTIAFFAESWFNLLPPECTPIAPPDEPTIATPAEWLNATISVQMCFFPCCSMCECTLEMWVLIFYNYLPPWAGE